MEHTTRFKQLAADAKTRVNQTDVETVNSRRAKGDQFILIDVREESEWQRSYIPGAIHLGKGVIERDIEKAVPNTDAEIVLYCGGGSRSSLAGDALLKMGYTNVYSMDGGFRGWKAAGFELVEGEEVYV